MKKHGIFYFAILTYARLYYGRKKHLLQESDIKSIESGSAKLFYNNAETKIKSANDNWYFV